jgi:hypothetical protein
MRNPISRAFRALENFNFRLWTAGGLVSNIGTLDAARGTRLDRADATDPP